MEYPGADCPRVCCTPAEVRAARSVLLAETGTQLMKKNHSRFVDSALVKFALRSCLAVAIFGALPAMSAERTVLLEEFTNLF
jgi:hypothetical protein